MNPQPLVVPKSAVFLPTNATDPDILSAVECWVEALAKGDYNRAYDMTAHESYYDWTPQLLRQVIEGYGLPEPHPDGPFRVTPLKSAGGESDPRHEVERFDGPNSTGAIGQVWFDLPLNGVWSDLTATFAVHPFEDKIVLALNEVHVF